MELLLRKCYTLRMDCFECFEYRNYYLFKRFDSAYNESKCHLRLQYRQMVRHYNLAGVYPTNPPHEIDIHFLRLKLWYSTFVLTYIDIG